MQEVPMLDNNRAKERIKQMVENKGNTEGPESPRTGAGNLQNERKIASRDA
jgi:hypothetical protein